MSRMWYSNRKVENRSEKRRRDRIFHTTRFFAIESFQEIIDLHCPVDDCSFSLKDKTISELEDWFEEMREKD